MIKLLSHQPEGIRFLKSHSFCLLADEMGVGKTPQAIIAAQELSRILVVCPSVAKYNWQKEFERFAGRHAEVAGDGKILAGKPLVITSFDYLTRHLEKYKKFHRDLVIIDEAHLSKEPTALRTKAVMGVRGIIRHTDRLWALTGTPAPNHAGELWVYLYTFGYTKLSYEGFVNRYCNTHRDGSYYGKINIVGTNTKHSGELRAMLKRCALRRLKKDVLDLPPQFHNTYYIDGDSDAILKDYPELKSKLKKELQSLSERLDFEVGTDLSDSKLIAVLQAMSQSISSLRRYHGLKKIKPVADLVKDELLTELYDKIIIFGIHTDVLKLLAKSFRQSNFEVALIIGETPPRERHLIQERFQNEPDLKIVIANIQAGGTNLTLTAASQVLFIELDWVPGNNKQAADRAHRHGQRNAVTVRHVCIRDSIDAKITTTLVRKIREIKTFMD